MLLESLNIPLIVWTEFDDLDFLLLVMNKLYTTLRVNVTLYRYYTCVPA